MADCIPLPYSSQCAHSHFALSPRKCYREHPKSYILTIELYYHESTLDADATKLLVVELVVSHLDRCRPHEVIDDRFPTEVMRELFDRFERDLEYIG